MFAWALQAFSGSTLMQKFLYFVRYTRARICERVTGAFLICNAGKFQCAAYSVWCARNFCCTGYARIINNAVRTLLTKACKSGFYLIVSFWLRFIL